jgi:hypothetical protein
MRPSIDDRELVTDDEIVRDVTDSLLKPWAPEILWQIKTGQSTEAELHTEISNAVRAGITLLRDTVRDFFDREAIRKTRDDARGIVATIARLEEQLQKASPGLRLRLRLDAALDDKAGLPVARLLHALRDVCAECQATDNALPNVDQVKLWCVRVAMNLMLRFSAKKPTVGSDASRFCTIAGLLYESVTGKKDQSLRYICEDVLRQYRPLLPPRKARKPAPAK